MRRTAVTTLWAFIGVSALLLRERLWAVTILAVVAIAVTAHLYSLPTEVTPAKSD